MIDNPLKDIYKDDKHIDYNIEIEKQRLKEQCKKIINTLDGLDNDLQSFIDKEDAELQAIYNGDLLGGIILGVGFFGTLGVFALLKVFFP